MLIGLDRFGGLWRYRDFLRLWTGQTISAFGDLIGGSALQFTAILVLGATPFQMSMLGAARLVPGVALGLVAGAWIDRVRRRPIMLCADLGRALLLATIPLAAITGVLHIEQLYFVAVAVGLLALIFDVAYQSYLPSLLDRADLVEGNSKLTSTRSIAQVAGFGTAGWLVQIFSAPIAIAFDAASFLLSFAFVGSIRAVEPLPRPPDGESNVWREVVDGLRVSLGDPFLRTLVGSAFILFFSFGLFGTLIILYVVRDLGFTPGVVGVIFAVGGVSSLVGSVVAQPVARAVGLGPAMILGVTFMGFSMFFVPLAPGASVFSAAMLVAQQLFGDGWITVYMVSETTLRQTIAPPAYLGRVNACARFTTLGATLLGTVLSGILAEAVGLRGTLAFGAGGVLSAALWLALSPIRSLRDMPPALETTSTA